MSILKSDPMSMYIRTDDGHLICMCPRGLVDISPDLRQKLREGQPVNPSKYYFRAAYFFETLSEKYAWLNKIIAVGVLERTATGVTGIVYEVVWSPSQACPRNSHLEIATANDL